MKIGILGGTFDPIHIVHMIIAEQVRDTFQLDQIWFMPAHVPPHKEGKKVTDSSHRLQMVRLAIGEIPYFIASSFELDRAGPSYTIDTVRALKEQFPEDQFFFIIGGDMVDYLPHWHQIKDLVKLIQFIGVHRPGYEPDHFFSREYVKNMAFPQVDISSTMIRERINRGNSIRFMVREEVRLYIEEKRLYES